MKTTVKKLDAQLKTWRDRIENLASSGPRQGAADGRPSPERIAELRKLHASAEKEFTGFRVADAAERAKLKPQTVRAWNALAAAVKTPKPTT